MINIVVCDDNEKDRNNAVKVVKDFMSKSRIDYDIYVYKDYDNEFRRIIKSPIPFKIYLLDIETPSASGIDIAREIRMKDVDSIIVFMTVHDDLGNLLLKDELMFLAFINKFDDFKNRLNKCLSKSLELFQHKRIIRINDKNIIYTIDTNDILYISKDSFERKTIIKTDYVEFKVNKSLTDIVSMLDDRFVQTHRSCYINIDRKVKIDKGKKLITFDNGETTDLMSDKYKKELIR